MINKDFYIDKDGFKLHAKLDFPKEPKEKMPVLVLVHGITGHMDEAHLECVKDASTECGLACLRVDMYGHGKSDGSFCNHNMMEWVSELLFVIDYARELDFATDIYLAGHSQGGLTVILAAALKANQIKALIPISPAINIVYNSLAGELFGVNYDANNIPEMLPFWDDYKIKGNYFRIAQTIKLEEAFLAYEGPVYVIHGSDDDAVDISYGMEVKEKYKNSVLKLIEGADHCFNNHFDDLDKAVKEILGHVCD